MRLACATRPTADLYVDLGTANTLVCRPGAGVVLDEPSVVAIAGDGERLLAAGSRARDMLGRLPDFLRAIRPLRGGVIAEYDAAVLMLRHFLARSHRRRWRRPRVLASLPHAVTDLERRAVHEAMCAAGAREVTLITEPMAAAVGAALPVLDARGSMIVDVGGGTTEVALISLGGIVECRAVRQGGDHMDEAIVRLVRRRHGVLIGERTAERLKMSLASTGGTVDALDVSGGDVATGLPRAVRVGADDVWEAVEGILGDIVAVTRATLEAAPAELAADVADSGICLSGGGALVRGLDTRLAEATGVPVHVPARPLATVALGGQAALESESLLRRIMHS